MKTGNRTAMDVLVTGATGFVGANVARLLVADGYRVRVLARSTSSLRALEGCPVEVLRGDILQPDAGAGALEGCARVFHVAADYRLWARDPGELYRTNVDGTRTVLEGCARAGVERVIYTSSVGTLGLARDGAPGTETTPVTLDDMIGHYKRSKFLAERVAEAYAARGVPVVIVNPTNPIGPWEVKPTPTGQVILDYLLGRMVGTLDTGLNLLHVADVARGHLLAASLGRVGEKYILGGENHSLAGIFQMLERITGIRAPRLRVPHALAYLAAQVNEALARVTGRPPRVPLAGVRMARTPMYFSAEKAVRELGLPQTPVDQALRDAVDWFVDHGYAPSPPAYRRPAAWARPRPSPITLRPPGNPPPARWASQSVSRSTTATAARAAVCPAHAPLDDVPVARAPSPGNAIKIARCPALSQGDAGIPGPLQAAARGAVASMFPMRRGAQEPEWRRDGVDQHPDRSEVHAGRRGNRSQAEVTAKR